MTAQRKSPARSGEIMVRQAKLRVAFAHLYPSVTADVWMPAAEVSAQVLFHRYMMEGPSALGRRPLDDGHFEFRGGWARVQVLEHTRANDTRIARAGP